MTGGHETTPEPLVLKEVRDGIGLILLNRPRQRNALRCESWTELSELRKEFEPDAHDWVKTVRLDIAVPRIIRLIGYDKLPRQEVKLNRRNLFARDRNRCQYCGNHFPTSAIASISESGKPTVSKT